MKQVADALSSPNTLLYKWLVVNSFALLVLYVAWLQDWITLVITSDASYLSVAIAVVFAVFWCVSTYRMIAVNREIRRFHDREPNSAAGRYFEKLRAKSSRTNGEAIDQSMLAGTLQARLLMPVQAVNYVSGVLILLGLIGTVIGFVIAVSGLGDSLAGGENLGRVQAVLGQIVNGMGVALFTTLVGSILGGLWLQLHFQMLSRAINGLVVDIVEQADIEVIPSLVRGSTDYARAVAE